MDYSVKNIKTFYGHDGGCWEASLYNPEGKRVAIVTENGWGGELDFHWLNHKHHNNPNVDSVALDKFCKTLPKCKAYDDTLVETDSEIYLCDLVNDFLTAKEVKKVLKKVAIWFHGKIFTFNIPATEIEWAKPAILKNHPNAVFLNTLALSEAVKIYKQSA